MEGPGQGVTAHAAGRIRSRGGLARGMACGRWLTVDVAANAAALVRDVPWGRIEEFALPLSKDEGRECGCASAPKRTAVPLARQLLQMAHACLCRTPSHARAALTSGDLAQRKQEEANCY